MKIAIINGIIGEKSKTMDVSIETKNQLENSIYKADVISLVNFTELFKGSHITLETANELQLEDFRIMINADILLFIVPIYHHTMPGSLKNFFDMIDVTEAFNNKVIAFISANKDSFEGAINAKVAVESIISFKRLHSFALARIERIDPENIDAVRLKNFLDYVLTFVDFSTCSNTCGCGGNCMCGN